MADSEQDRQTLSPELLEKFRQTGIRLDRHGQFWHEGQPIAHRGLRSALLRWLDVLDDGRPVLRLDESRYAYIDVEDTHLLVVSARWRDDRVFVVLNDDGEEELAYASLRVDSGNVLYCSARSGRLSARVTTSAYYVIAEGVEEYDGTFVLCARGQRYAIGRK